ncbi:hypothetical protein ACE38V_19075 [Cytobacillus sp. Hz8]|uniref:hypothetical protein n=1 Tax=Cytobacillus sp. Hz8 TaxID=3347168 RepID=UPI0035DFCD3F
MATETIFQRFTLDEETSKKIISTPHTKIKQTNVFNDIKLNKSERLANAARILNSRKCK